MRTIARHVVSGNTIITEAPVDNLGRGEAFSTTDLFPVSLRSCMLMLMGITAYARRLKIDGAKISIIKFMAANPRRVAKIKINFEMPDIKYTIHEKEVLEYAALNFPVAKSIHPEIVLDVVFNYKD